MQTATVHPWNVGFRWADTEPTHGALTAAQVRVFDTDGFVVVRQVFTPDEIAAVRAVIDGFEAEAETALRQLDDDRLFIAEAGAITFSPHLVSRSPELAAFARHRAFAALAADLVGPDVDIYWDQAVYKKPEKPRRFPWHQDNGYAFVEPQQYLTCWVPLTDARLENGCPQIAPGLHRLGTLAHRYVDPLGYECFPEPPVEVAVAEAAVGDVIVFSSLTPHLTGPNLTDEVRKAYILQYSPVGAEVLEGDPGAGAPTGRRACTEPRHLPVARRGRPVPS
ncbi:MAG TPA: phytanoyl-CoA dioxygenase family protein [Iamia sp.]|nr:phytanoyl-CoA dioxygenase family protein [Iamia sp.]